jgi:hypothetical protein
MKLLTERTPLKMQKTNIIIGCANFGAEILSVPMKEGPNVTIVSWPGTDN